MLVVIDRGYYRDLNTKIYFQIPPIKMKRFFIPKHEVGSASVFLNSVWLEVAKSVKTAYILQCIFLFQAGIADLLRLTLGGTA